MKDRCIRRCLRRLARLKVSGQPLQVLHGLAGAASGSGAGALQVPEAPNAGAAFGAGVAVSCSCAAGLECPAGCCCAGCAAGLGEPLQTVIALKPGQGYGPAARVGVAGVAAASAVGCPLAGAVGAQARRLLKGVRPPQVPAGPAEGPTGTAEGPTGTAEGPTGSPEGPAGTAEGPPCGPGLVGAALPAGDAAAGHGVAGSAVGAGATRGPDGLGDLAKAEPFFASLQAYEGHAAAFIGRSLWCLKCFEVPGSAHRSWKHGRCGGVRPPTAMPPALRDGMLHQSAACPKLHASTRARWAVLAGALGLQ